MGNVRFLQRNCIKLALFALALGLCVGGAATDAKAVVPVPDPVAYYIDSASNFGTIDLFTGTPPIDLVTGMPKAVVPLTGGPGGYNGLGEANGVLYTVHNDSAGLYSINTSTGEVTLVGTNSGIVYSAFGSTTIGLYAIGMYPVSDQYYYLFSIDPGTGVATPIGAEFLTTPGNGGIGITYALSTGSPTLYAAGHESGAFDYQFYTFDTTIGGAPTAVGSPESNTDSLTNALTVAGSTLYAAADSGSLLATIAPASGTMSTVASNISPPLEGLAPYPVPSEVSATSGSLSVTISPPAAASAGATWNVDGGATSYTSGTIAPNLSVGSHTVAFSNLQGWTAPSSQQVTVTNGQTTYITGSYTPVYVALFTASTTSGKIPLNVHFTNSSAGSFKKCLWRFGDGQTSKAWSPNHAYRKAGVFTVTLTLTGAKGTISSTQPGLITVYAAPKAHFSAAPRSGDAPLTVNFTNQSTGIVANSLWYFGDGATSTDPNPTHTYENPHTYTAKLIVYGPGGSGSKTMSIHVEK